MSGRIQWLRRYTDEELKEELDRRHIKRFREELEKIRKMKQAIIDRAEKNYGK